jgi:branched-chain amino acid transport system permease protein
MSPDIIVNTLVLGSIYLTFSVGFTLVYGTFGVMNLAHATILTLGAFLALIVVNTLRLPLALAFVAAALGAGVMNAALDALVIRPIRRTSTFRSRTEELAPIIATLSFSLLLGAIIQYQAPVVLYTYQGTSGLATPLEFLGLRVSVLEIGILATAAVVVAGSYWLIERTQLGITIRAVAEDRYMASALGVRASIVHGAVFFLSGALAGVCGVLVGLLYTSVQPSMGDDLLLYGFVIVTVGGLGSLTGTALASFLVAIAKTAASHYLSGPSIDVWIFLVLLAVLVLRPQGLLGRRVLSSGIVRR